MSEQKPTRGLLGWLVIASPLLLFGALAIIFFVQLTSGRDSGELPSALIDNPAPQFDLPPLPNLNAGNDPVPGIKTADLKGKPHLVNIFASWCAPCRAEHPVLVQLSKDKRMNIVGVNYKDDPANALRFLGQLGNPYTRVGIDPKGRTAIDWGFYGIPETLLVDGSGIVRHKVIGPITAKKYEGLLKALDEITSN